MHSVLTDHELFCVHASRHQCVRALVNAHVIAIPHTHRHALTRTHTHTHTHTHTRTAKSKEHTQHSPSELPLSSRAWCGVPFCQSQGPPSPWALSCGRACLTWTSCVCFNLKHLKFKWCKHAAAARSRPCSRLIDLSCFRQNLMHALIRSLTFIDKRFQLESLSELER